MRIHNTPCSRKSLLLGTYLVIWKIPQFLEIHCFRYLHSTSITRLKEFHKRWKVQKTSAKIYVYTLHIDFSQKNLTPKMTSLKWLIFLTILCIIISSVIYTWNCEFFKGSHSAHIPNFQTSWLFLKCLFGKKSIFHRQFFLSHRPLQDSSNINNQK